MCGIAGIFQPDGRPVDAGVLAAMTRALTHRGPDEDGFYLEGNLGLGQRRLSIIDLSGGRQPIFNEDRTVCTVFNGEIFNYLELRETLEKKGHRFSTHTDTETIVHAYEEYGRNFVDHLNGQFAIALWDLKRRELILARDRVGIRPLFYARLGDGSLVFGSEMKCLFHHPGLLPEIDPQGLNQILTFWVNVPPRTIFKGVNELGPGECLTVLANGDTSTRRYWRITFPRKGEYEDRPVERYAEGLREILHDSLVLQLRADVPVASYLSGGIDSSIISALVKKHHNHDLLTYSVAFHDQAFDESPFQTLMAEALGTRHRVIRVDNEQIAACFPQVVWHAEKPMIRTAPAPLYLLAGLVRETGIKVVLTGEGADEIFGGYNIFREDKVRRFWAREPESKFRPLLLSALYPYINKNPSAQSFWRMFFRKGLSDTENPYYSHLIRWNNTAQIKRMLTPETAGAMDDEAMFAELDAYLEKDIVKWHPLCRAQYLEMTLFMSGYLLSSQGDRMMMGQSIEGRFPFLDHRVIEYGATIPPKHKVNGLAEKYVLKKAFADILPKAIVDRPKQPYRAPISKVFLDKESEAGSMLREDKVRAAGFFDPEAMSRLVAKTRESKDAQSSAREEMALVAAASLHLLKDQFRPERFRAEAGTPGEA